MSIPAPAPLATAAYDGARRDLEAFVAAQPECYYRANAHLRRILPLYVRPDRAQALDRDLLDLGAAAAGPIDDLVRLNNLEQNLPRLERYDAVGRPVETISHHPSYHEIGRMLYRSGMLEALTAPDDMVGAVTRHYLSSHNGEAGHNCPIACSAGVIRALQSLGSEELKARYLPRLLTRDYDEHLEGAQFLTEIQGGSDVGANATVALRAIDGSFRIHGEKWFATNIDADLFLMTARFEHGAAGTRGLGLFLVPRRRPDGSLNAFSVRRLKEKIGTRSLASSETDFHGAFAYHLGPEESGFHHMMELVVNTSRIYIGTGCAGQSMRAFLVAHAYARHRRAFGRSIIEYKLIQQTLADMRAEAEAMLSGSLHLAWLHDRIVQRETSTDELDFFRLALNLNKMRSARRTREITLQAIEVLAGNGAIETFSVLPRLLRDILVIENWEGTYNTLLNQIARDMERYRVHEGFFRTIAARLGGSSTNLPGLMADTDRLQTALAALPLASDPEEARLALRPLAEQTGALYYAVVRAWERQQIPEDTVDEASFRHFIARSLGSAAPPATGDYTARLETLTRAPA